MRKHQQGYMIGCCAPRLSGGDTRIRLTPVYLNYLKVRAA